MMRMMDAETSKTTHVEMLRRLLAQAEAGGILGLQMMVIYTDGCFTQYYVADSRTAAPIAAGMLITVDALRDRVDEEEIEENKQNILLSMRRRKM